MSHAQSHRCVWLMYWLSVFLGYNGGYGSAGLGLGHRYGNGWMKGPKPGRTMITAKR